MNEGYAVVCVGEKWGLIDGAGKFTIKPKYRLLDGLQNVSEGLARFTTDEGKSGFIDPSGKVVVPARFRYLSDFSNGLAVASTGDEFGCIDHSGNFVVKALDRHYGADRNDQSADHANSIAAHRRSGTGKKNEKRACAAEEGDHDGANA